MIALRYHDQTKHHFNRFARSLGYLDWASQPDPFRRYTGARLFSLPRAHLAPAIPYDALFDGSAPSVPINEASIGEFLRCSVGLSAWKQYGTSRWALRVNPSSGNLHPTESYIVWNERVWHYAAREHALEERCVLSGDRRTVKVRPAEEGHMRREPLRLADDAFLVALTSIHWREAWKYGERAFRYCQHDAGHAIGAMRCAAAMLGWRLTLLPQWSHQQLSALLGIDRDADYGDAEREEAECLMVVTAGDVAAWRTDDPAALVEAATRAAWTGKANQLSADRADWPIIEEISAATRASGATVRWDDGATVRPMVRRSDGATEGAPSARSIVLQRRSATAFDAQSGLRRDAFLSMLRRLQPGAPPWDAIDWSPHVHLALFVHRVADLEPGIYAYLRDPAVLEQWRASMRTEFLWEQVEPGLFLLLPIDCRRMAHRVSCDQDIAADGFFSLGMLARFEPALRERGESFYRRLFWECGLIGQVLYLEAEAAGGRATGIGCFYDDPVHEVLGLSGHDWQSLYHFSMGVPVEDTRLTSAPGYDWETPAT